MRKLYLLLACVLVLSFGATSAWAEQDGRYIFALSPLNNSGVSGESTISLGDEGATIVLDTDNLDPDQVHEMHIHGIEGQDVSCPTDANGDGMVNHDEASRQAGEHVLNLKPYPTADGSGNISLERTYTEGVGGLAPLETRVIIVHGMTVDGEYMSGMPTACGEISAMEEIPATGGLNIGLISISIGAVALGLGVFALRLTRRSV